MTKHVAMAAFICRGGCGRRVDKRSDAFCVPLDVLHSSVLAVFGVPNTTSKQFSLYVFQSVFKQVVRYLFYDLPAVALHPTLMKRER